MGGCREKMVIFFCRFLPVAPSREQLLAAGNKKVFIKITGAYGQSPAPTVCKMVGEDRKVTGKEGIKKAKRKKKNSKVKLSSCMFPLRFLAHLENVLSTPDNLFLTFCAYVNVKVYMVYL